MKHCNFNNFPNSKNNYLNLYALIASSLDNYLF